MTVSAVVKIPQGVNCVVCGQPSVFKCNECTMTPYCGVSCEKRYRLVHKQRCHKLAELAGLKLSPDPGAWEKNLNVHDQRYRYLVDAYRLHVSDWIQYGDECVGLNSTEDRGYKVAEDFLAFCILAVKRRVIESKRSSDYYQGSASYWNWATFLKVAGDKLHISLAKSAAESTWGQENIFNVLNGGRSLRYTYQQVYGCGAENIGRMPGDAVAVFDMILRTQPFEKETEPCAFADVGGASIWLQLLETVMKKLSPNSPIAYFLDEVL